MYVHGVTPSFPIPTLTDGTLELPLNQFEVFWRHLDGEKVEESAELGLGDPTGVALALHRGEGGEGEGGRGRGSGREHGYCNCKGNRLHNRPYQEHLLCILGDTEPIINMQLVYVHITATNMHLVCLIS